MIAIVDLGIGNLSSVRWALERMGQEARMASDPDGVVEAAGIVLPGVGNFAAASERLRESGLRTAILERVNAVPLLGICLGMQLLFEGSEEGGEGLGLLCGGVRRLDPPGLPVPHTGWNTVEVLRSEGLFSLAGSGDAYFVHSYAVEPEDPGSISATSDYGGRFVAGVEQGNVFGVQFHPERSGAYGRLVLGSFIEEVKACSRSSRRSTCRTDASSA